jgi:hypothetical protein
MIPLCIKLVEMLILHSTLRICSLAMVTSSSGASSHFSLNTLVSGSQRVLYRSQYVLSTHDTHHVLLDELLPRGSCKLRPPLIHVPVISLGAVLTGTSLSEFAIAPQHSSASC